MCKFIYKTKLNNSVYCAAAIAIRCAPAFPQPHRCQLRGGSGSALLLTRIPIPLSVCPSIPDLTPSLMRRSLSTGSLSGFWRTSTTGWDIGWERHKRALCIGQKRFSCTLRQIRPVIYDVQSSSSLVPRAQLAAGAEDLAALAPCRTPPPLACAFAFTAAAPSSSFSSSSRPPRSPSLAKQPIH
jgi:hypothetical protein